MAWRDTPLGRLAAHFFESFFDSGVLGESGGEAAESFRSLVAGILAFLVSIGLLMVRALMMKYAGLSRLATPDPYRRALLGDDLLLVALPMLVAALVAVLVGQALFPDETDFRVLVPLPVSRRVIFGGKLVALALFAGIFTVGSHVALTPVMLLASLSRWAEHTWLARVAAMWAAGLFASLFAFLSVAALHGAIVTCVPAAFRRALSTLVRSALVAALALCLPLAGRLPALGPELDHRLALMLAVPPAWFVGVSRVLLGEEDPFFVRLALLGLAALAIAALVAASSYVALYRRFDRVMLQAHRTLPRLVPPALPAARSKVPEGSAMRLFVGTTLRRSPLHQGVLAGFYACGFALVVNGLLGHGILEVARGVAPSRGLIAACIGAAFTTVFIAIFGVRLAVSLPIDLRANWVFRMVESDARRPELLRAAPRALATFGVALPLALLCPVLVLVLGAEGVVVVGVAALAGLLLVEAVVLDWQRLPFTCTYLPGKRALPQVVLLGFTAFVVYRTLGRALALASLASAAGAAAIAVCGVAALVALRRRRRREWRATPLAFEDVPPYRVESLRLSVD